ncbi:aminoglycoside phosphotransferase family protein [Halobacteriovorax sp. HLS]|uniref:aminoglycoside phosphotransferase family protein n=1 Tax=Halobacteriovorax sp. HLS TaxID=2234000 RepID=UPI000FD88AFA|nr:phosphotransferase [Halobacteriovorax sp. HLS]
MKPEDSERLLITELFENSQRRIDSLKENEVVEVVKLTGDASTRRYYRIVTKDCNYVSCLSEVHEDIEKSDFTIVQKVLHHNLIRVPQIIDQNSKKGYMLQEDLGNLTFLSYISSISSTEKIFEEYKKVVDTLIKIQSIPRESEYNWGKLSFDVEKLMFEINFTKKFFVEKFLNAKLSREESVIFERINMKIINEITSKDMVLNHRDFHSRNIMVKEGEFVYIDFQDARQGVPQYDLVSLLEDCYFQISEENIEKLKMHYFNSFLKNTSKDQTSYEEFSRIYDLMTIQRSLKAIGSFCYIYETRSDIRYVKYIGYAFEKVRNKLRLFPEYEALYKLLVKVYYAS